MKSTLAPQSNPQFALATNEFVEVHNISFFFKPSALQAIVSALVAVFTVIQYLLFHQELILFYHFFRLSDHKII